MTSGSSRTTTTVWRLAPIAFSIAILIAGCTEAGNPQRAGRSLSDAVTVGIADDALEPEQPLGGPHCDPSSPMLGTESRLTGDGIEGWALLWELPPWPVNKDVKVVWRVGGSGDFDAVAISPGGREVEPSFGPQHHVASSWKRPGEEWGTGFILDDPGCWELRVSRDEGTASLWLEVAARP